MKQFWRKHRALLIIFIIVFLLRLPLLFEPFTYADEGIYLTLGQAARKGLVLYRDIHDNKPPLLYLIAALAGNFQAYRLIYFLWSFATLFVFYQLAHLLFEKSQKATLISTGVFAILTSLPAFEGNIANAENFMLLPTSGAFLLILQTLGKKSLSRNSTRKWFWAGFLFSLATLFKVPAAFDFAAAFVFIFLALGLTKKNYQSLLANYLFLLLGFLLPILVSLVYFASQGALHYYLTAAFAQNLPYLASWGNNKASAGSLPLPLLGRALVVFLIVVFLFVFRKKVSLRVKLVLTWFFFTLFAALLSSRPYPHYLIQVLPSFCLAWGFLAFPQKWLKSLPVFFGGLLVFVFLSFHFWYYANLPYLVNFWSFAFGFKSPQEYFSYFDKQAQDLYTTANFIKTHTQPKEKIFIWGTRPSIYSLSGRLPVGRYTTSYHIIDFNGYQETLDTLNQNPPRWIIDTQEEKRDFPGLRTFLEENYVLFQQIGKFKIFYQLPESARL